MLTLNSVFNALHVILSTVIASTTSGKPIKKLETFMENIDKLSKQTITKTINRIVSNFNTISLL